MDQASDAVPDTFPTAPHIKVEAVRKSYGDQAGGPRTEVLRGVSLEAWPGEFVGLMGASGSGKTTLLNLIGGLDTPDAGRIEIGGRDLRQLADARRSEFRLRNIGFVFQFFNLLPHLSVRENIALPLLFLNRPTGEAYAAAESLAGEVGLADKLDRQIHQLSGGEMQRVALGRALVHRPMALLADEPTGNLDSRTGQTILELIQTLATRHRRTVLMATHDRQAATVADRILHMRDGRIVDD